MAYRIETGIRLTPKIAEEWLHTVKRQRNINDAKVVEYAKIMKSGGWVPNNGTTMIFDTNGEFRDGQHRAWAVMNSKVTITVCVAYDVNPDAVRTVDIGMRRTGADTLVMETKAKDGVPIPYSKAIAAAMNYVVAFEKGNIYNEQTLSNEEIWKKFEDNREIVESAKRVCPKNKIARTSICTALHYIFTRVDAHRELANEFFDRFISGESLPAKSPILVLRNKFIAIRNDPKASVGRGFIISCIVKAWIAWVTGKEVSNFTYNPEALPQPPKKIKIGRNSDGKRIVRVDYEPKN